MAAIAVKVNIISKIVADTKRESMSSPRTTVELLVEAVEESGQDQSDSVTVVTPRSVHIYHLPSKFKTAIQESDTGASAELVY